MVNHVTFPGLGLEFTVNRVAISLGNFNIYWYGILISLGLLLAIGFAFRYAEDFGINSDRMIDAIVIGTVCGVICARAYYVAFAPFQYNSFREMIDIRDGGIAIYGGIIGGFLFGGLACKWRKIPVLAMFDLTSMGFLIGQCIGRWGNFTNQEAFGCNTSLPWGMHSENTQSYLAAWQETLAAQGVTVDPLLPVHPTFLYESLWCLTSFIILFAFMKKRRYAGEILLWYIVLYGTGRFFIEGLRTDSLMLPGVGLRTSQVVALVSVTAALIMQLILRRKYKQVPYTIQLAREDVKRPLPTEESFTAEISLPVRASHREFVQKTKMMNQAVKDWYAAQQQKSQPEEAEQPSAEEAEEPHTQDGTQNL